MKSSPNLVLVLLSLLLAAPLAMAETALTPARSSLETYLSPVLPEMTASLAEPGTLESDDCKINDELMKNYLASIHYDPASVALPGLDDNIPYPVIVPPPDEVYPILPDPPHKTPAMLKAAKKLQLKAPLSKMVVSSPYGQRWGRMHEGLDLAANAGTPIHASEAGRIAYAGWVEGYGNFVVVDHGNGYSTRYGHASQLKVKAGDTVKRGQTIALVGSTGHSTGPHLHFEVVTLGAHRNPASYLGQTIHLAAKAD